MRRFWIVVLIGASFPHLGFLQAQPKVPSNFYLNAESSGQQRLTNQNAVEVSKTLLEKKTILSLIDQVSHSPYEFIRNGSVYSGPEAAKHLRWKYMMSRGRVKTAEQFIINIATRSMVSGQLYLVRIASGKTFPLKQVLQNELLRLQPVLEGSRRED